MWQTLTSTLDNIETKGQENNDHYSSEFTSKKISDQH